LPQSHLKNFHGRGILASLGLVVSHTITTPEASCEANGYWKRFRGIIISSCCQRRLQKLSFSTCVGDSIWDYEFDESPNIHDGLQDIEQFSFNVTSPIFGDSKAFLRSMIKNMPILKSLQLHFRTLELGQEFNNHRYLKRMFISEPRRKFLRALSLRLVVTEPKNMQALPKRYSTTLRSLELNQAVFGYSDESPEQPSGCEKAPWILLFDFLNQSMKLDHVQLEGDFTSQNTEAWTTRGKEENVVSPPYPSGCLIDQIERFITQNGPCPFTPRVPEVETYMAHQEEFQH